jgi:hypothetical protein
MGLTLERRRRILQGVVGEAWRSLASEFERELRDMDADAHVRPTIDASGLLRLDVVSKTLDRRVAKRAARSYEAKAASLCETCGGTVSSVRILGPGVIGIFCDGCGPR